MKTKKGKTLDKAVPCPMFTISCIILRHKGIQHPGLIDIVKGHIVKITEGKSKCKR